MKGLNLINQPNAQESEKIAVLSNACNISFYTAQILYYRGYDTTEKIYKFFNPSKEDFNDPYLLKDMKEVVERIKQAKENGETVLVYGDYDVDGISATTILYSALRDYGVKAEYIIPERADGYGLSMEVIERATDMWQEAGYDYPDLVITVDCGISDKNVIEEIKNIGMEVIVTDHHEIPDELPDCLVVNPKRKEQKYPFDGLCGAAVAYKTAYALLGEIADKYLDLATVATVADSMSLIEENRAIVSEGLKLLTGKKVRKQYLTLLGNSANKNLTASSLAYTVAPRINAAGRMGDAFSALRLFMTEDDDEIFELSAKLNAYNMERQGECDNLYKKAKEQLAKGGAYEGAVVVADEKWKTGLAGIVAAKLVEEYNRPVIIFTGATGGTLKGSARSINGVNIFEAISNFKDMLVEYGGHSQAAGVSITKENYEKFKKGFCDYIYNNNDESVFDCTVSADIEIDTPITLDFAKELERFEPCGVGNRKPLIATKIRNVEPMPLKPTSPHISFKTTVGDMLWFNSLKEVNKLTSTFEKYLVFELNIAIYNNKESLKGFVKDVVYTGEELAEIDLLTAYGNVLTLKNGDKFSYGKRPMVSGIDEYLNDRYGTAFIVYNKETLNKYPKLNDRVKDIFRPSDRSLRSRVIVAPYDYADLQDYRRFVFLDAPLGDYPIEYGKEIIIVNNETDDSILDNIKLEREDMAAAFNEIKKYCGKVVENAYSLYNSVTADLSLATFTVAYESFIELGFFYYEGVILRYNANVKAPLDNSVLYSTVRRMIECRKSMKN